MIHFWTLCRATNTAPTARTWNIVIGLFPNQFTHFNRKICGQIFLDIPKLIDTQIPNANLQSNIKFISSILCYFFFGRTLVSNSTGKLKRVQFAICKHCSQSKMQNVLIFSMLFDGTGFLHFHRKIQHEIVKIRCAFFHTRESVNSSTPPGSYSLYADHFMFIVLPIDSSCLETTFQLNDRIGASFVV